MAAPQTEVWTFLFSDIEGSTPLWERYPQVMTEILAWHDATVAAAIAAEGGLLVKSTGDGVLAAFVDSTAAVLAAVTMQQVLGEAVHPPVGRLKVRIGIHRGPAVRREGDFFGPTLNRCARLMAAGHGDQILVSGSAASDLVLPAGWGLLDLGTHALRSLVEPEVIAQVTAPHLVRVFPALRTAPTQRHNLPAETTRFIGREVELAEALELLAGRRVLTICGPGGCGKTRLADRLAAEVLDDYPDGVWRVSLADLPAGVDIEPSLARALGVEEELGRTLREVLQDHLQAKQSLLLLDNAEQVIDAVAAVVEALLVAAPGLRVLVTSQEPLQVGAEALYRLPPLPCPGHGLALEQIAELAAVALFVDRAAAVRPGFALDAQNAPTVAAIVRRLDGLPLAIELAAARVRVLTPAQIAERLDDRFRLLTGGSRTALARHQTLATALSWSYDLLAPAEREVFAKLSVFRGGADLDAVAAVCGDGDPLEVLDTLAALVDRSLLLSETAGEVERYRLLESLRLFGQEQLRQAGTWDAVAAEHARWFRELAATAAAQLRGPQQARWLDSLDRDHPNLQVALQYALRESDQPILSQELAAALWQYWYIRGHFTTGRRYLEAAVALVGGSPESRSEALNAAGILAVAQGDLAAGRVHHQAALTLRRELGDPLAVAGSLNNLGLLCSTAGEWAEATALFEEALPLYRAAGHELGLATVLNNLGNTRMEMAELQAAVGLLRESAAAFRSLGARVQAGAVEYNLAEQAWRAGDLETAEESARASLRERLDLGDQRGMVFCLSLLAHIAWQRGDSRRAALLAGQAMALREALAMQPQADEHARWDELETALQADPVSQADWETGREASLDVVVAVALGS
ncbi:MAG: tetratricopeptide repeat protein [Fimbriimonadaceae bacterium]|nr:tetratricopeptide repeat protein [Fimbriimonadaceae bacterium]